jgi:hypothetical protein
MAKKNLHSRIDYEWDIKAKKISSQKLPMWPKKRQKYLHSRIDQKNRT